MTSSLFSEAVKITTDPLGQYVSICIDTTVYGRVAVFKTVYWFTDQYYVLLQKAEPESNDLRVELRLKSEADSDILEQAGGEFLNRLLDQQVRQDVLIETANIRDYLVKKAFFEGTMHSDPDHLLSDESHISTADQSASDDPLKIGRETGAPS